MVFELLPPSAAKGRICASAVRTIAAWVGPAMVSLLVGCASLPSLDGRTQTFARTDTDSTRLGRVIAPHAAAYPGKTGVHPLPSGAEGFAARVVLAATADKTIDVQYYIWHGDQTGYLLFDEIWRAAERGVRVRMLLDDASTEGLDETVAALDAHPNIEVRLYNPLVYRRSRALNALDFTRANRRMPTGRSPSTIKPPSSADATSVTNISAPEATLRSRTST